MKIFVKIFASTWATLWYTFAVATVLIAVAFSLLRLFLPLINQYSVTVESYVSDIVGQPIKIQSLDAEWHGFGPSLVFNNVRLLDRSGVATIAQFSKANLGLDILESLTKWQISFNSLVLKGANLSIVRHETGAVTLTDFSFSTDKDDVDDSAQVLPMWLLGHRRVLLEVNNLIIEDKLHSGRRSHFSDLSVLLRNQGDRHIIDCVLVVSSSVNEKVVFSSDITGDIFLTDSWSGEFYLSGDNIDLSNFSDDINLLKTSVALGRTSFEFWGNWNNAKLKAVVGKINTQNVVFSNTNQAAANTKSSKSASKKYSLDKASALLQWQSKANGWSLVMDRVNTENNATKQPESQASVDYVRQDTASVVDVSINTLNVAQVSDLLAVLDLGSNKISDSLLSLKPQGEVQDVSLHIEDGESFRFHLSSKFNNISMNSWEKMPALSGISGQLVASESSGVISLDSSNAIIDVPYMFRTQLDFKKINGMIGWQQNESELIVETTDVLVSNEDARANIAMKLTLPISKKSPHMDLLVKFGDGNAIQTPKYLPINLLPKGALSWLDHAFKGGRITTGGVLYHGNFKDFPFDHGTGIFEVRFDLENGELDYMPKWSMVKDISTEVIFRGRSMTAVVDSGKILNSDVSNVVVELPDMTKKPLKVKIRGDVAGTTQDKIDYIKNASLLGKKYGKLLSTIAADGNSDLDLNITLDIKKITVSSEVTGNLFFKNNNFKHKTLGNILDDVTGNIEILPYGFRASGLQTQLFGQDSVVEINTLKANAENKSGFVGVKAFGKFDAAHLGKNYMPVLEGLVSGEGKFNVSLDLPLGKVSTKQKNTNDYININLESNLEGIDITLPPPFSKSKTESRKLLINTKIKSNNKTLYKIQYGDRLNSITEITNKGIDRIMRGEIRFGQGSVTLPDEQGFRLVGHLDFYSFDIWRSLMNQINETMLSKSPNKNVLNTSRRVTLSDYINSADLQVDDFRIFGQKATNLKVDLEKIEGKLVAQVNSKELKGKIVTPKFIERDPVIMDLEYWQLNPDSEASAVNDVDPRTIPAVDVSCKSVTYQGRNIGSVKLRTTKIVEGLRLEQLIIKQNSTTIVALGKWLVRGDKQESDFQLRLDSDDLGKTMSDLGYLDTIIGGSGTIDITVKWPGKLTDFDLEQLMGKVKLHFTDGRLMDVDPGSTGRRIFGLFSLQTLPKRLMLDFSDIYNKGFSFDIIEGNFTLDSGDAYTSDFYMISSSGKVRISGRTGIVAQDYDQKMIFTPHSADFVSILGLLLLPGTPWGFIIPQIFRENINNAISFTYLLTGTWNNPKVEPLFTELEDPDSDLFN